MVQARIDQVMLGQMLGDSEVAFYSAALQLVESLAFMALIMKSTFLPSIISAKKTSQTLYRERLTDYYRVSFVIALTFALALSLSSDTIISLLFGAAYAPAAPILAIMAFRLVNGYMGTARSAFLVTEGQIKFSLTTMIVGTIANIFLNFVLIPEHGSVGAVFATLISLTLSSFVIDPFYAPTRRNFCWMFRAMCTPHRLLLRH
jgi:O-antigen/teichoic acid export membrane protein